MKENMRGPARFHADIPVRYGAKGNMLEGRGNAVSEKGIGFSGKKVFFPGEFLEIEFCIDPAGAEWFKAQGIVRDATEECMGVEFVEMQEPDRMRILKAIYRQSARQYQA